MQIARPNSEAALGEAHVEKFAAALATIAWARFGALERLDCYGLMVLKRHFLHMTARLLKGYTSHWMRPIKLENHFRPAPVANTHDDAHGPLRNVLAGSVACGSIASLNGQPLERLWLHGPPTRWPTHHVTVLVLVQCDHFSDVSLFDVIIALVHETYCPG